ncbi:hypothetical protein [Streptomyces sp. NPDC020298]|uniref:hypothetical protein n=1 Tax=unclassified Streptomyces TaxID=2593676 RepID=UPI0033F7F6DE
MNEPTPVDTDQNAQLAELLRRARQDYEAAVARREDHEIRQCVRGNEPGGHQ